MAFKQLNWKIRGTLSGEVVSNNLVGPALAGRFMSNKFIHAIIAVVASLSGMYARGDREGARQPSRPLEIRITKPLRWRNKCLQVSIDRVSQSSNSLFLPTRGVYIDFSATLLTAEPSETPRVRWFNVEGVSDVVVLDAEPLAAGQTKHNDTCLAATVAVVNLKEKTSRLLPLRGKTKISAYYFLSERDWLTNKSQREAMFHTSPNTWPKVLKPEVTTIIVPIPCRETACTPGCDVPPLVREDERQIIPDVVSDEPKWIERGKAVSAELDKLQPPCNIP